MRDALIAEYQGYATTIAVNYCKKAKVHGQDWDDYIQTALEALVVAASRFDPNHESGASFKTLMVQYVHGYIKMYRNRGEGWHKDHKCRNDLSVAVPITYAQLGLEEGAPNVVERCSQGVESRLWVKELLGRVDKRDAEIFVRYDGAGECLREIGESMGLSHERVRQLRDRAKDKLWRLIKQDEFERRAA